MSTIRLVKPSSLTLHPEAALVPEMPPDQYAAFLADVRSRLCIDEPLKVVPGTSTVIDGRTRLKAALEAGFATVPVVDADLGADTPVIFMLRTALFRRQLTTGQAAALGAEIKAQLEAAAKQRQKEGAAKGGKRAGGKVPEQSPGAMKDRAGESREIAAKMAGTNSRYVSTAEKVKEKAPAVFADLKAGKVTLPEAACAVNGKPAERFTFVGTALASIVGFPAEAHTLLLRKGVRTVEQLDAHLPKVPRRAGQGAATRYDALEDLGLSYELKLKAGDAICDHLKPKPAIVHCAKCKATYDSAGRDRCPSCGLPAGAAPKPPTLSPCPFCGSASVQFVHGWAPRGKKGPPTHVMCNSCFATGPKVKNAREASVRAAWNKRAKK